jgi:DNA-binding XRE family transcriptional regulator
MTQAALLIAWRRERNLSQDAAAERMGVAQATWAQWETERKEPELGSAVAIQALTGGRVRANRWPSAVRALDTMKRALKRARTNREGHRSVGVAP